MKKKDLLQGYEHMGYGTMCNLWLNITILMGSVVKPRKSLFLATWLSGKSDV